MKTWLKILIVVSVFALLGAMPTYTTHLTNLWIGDRSQTSNVTVGENDFYVYGTSEFDGAMRVDGAVTMTSTLGTTGDLTAVNLITTGNTDIGNAATDTLTITSIIDGNVTLDDGAYHSPSLIFKDGSDNTATLYKYCDSGLFLDAALYMDDNAYHSPAVVFTDGSNNSATIYKICDSYLNLNADFSLDDGSGASPSFILKDGSDETAIFAKANSGNTTLTIQAADSFGVVTGNFRVGNGTPGTASMNGEDAYIEGQLEVDGTVQLDGAVTAASTLAVSDAFTASDSSQFDSTMTVNGLASFTVNVDIGNGATDTLTITSIIDGDVTLDDGTGASPSFILKDGSDETATFSKANSGNTSLTIQAADSFSVLTGNLRVGNGTPGTASMNGEDAYIEGQLEVDGAIQFDGVLTAAGGITDTTGGVTATEIADTIRELNLPGMAGWVVDSSNDIDDATAPSIGVVDNIPAIVWDNSSETTGIMHTFRVPDDYVSGLTLYCLISSSSATGANAKLDWQIWDNANATTFDAAAIAQDVVAGTISNLDASCEVLTLTLDTTGETAMVAGHFITVEIFNALTGAGNLELKGVTGTYTANQ